MPTDPPTPRERGFTLPTPRERGFTLIEMLAVLVILALALGILAGRGPARSPAFDARGAAEQLARGMRLARSQAIAGNADIPFTVDVARRAFQVGRGPWQPFPPTLDIGITAVPGETGTAARIVFAPDGGSTGGRVRVSGGGAALVVAVDWLSGRVTVGNGA